jgi:hypothetical protein
VVDRYADLEPGRPRCCRPLPYPVSLQRKVPALVSSWSPASACASAPPTREDRHRPPGCHYWTVSSDLTAPLVPVYPFDEPNQPVTLHAGQIGGLAVGDLPGAVELSWTPRPSLNWSVGLVTSPEFANRREATLLLRRPGGDMEVPAWVRGIDFDSQTEALSSGGWSNGAVFGSEEAPLDRIIAHWFNLPNWNGPIPLADTTADGTRRKWSGRWMIDSEGWKVTIDVRPDHGRVWRDLYKADTYVMTHVMELRRADGGEFTAAEAEPVLTALHVGFSFALGRWTAPMLPVGVTPSGNVAWESWAVGHCDPAQAPSSGWWYERDHESLTDFLRPVIAASEDPDALFRLRFQMTLSIMAAGSDGFVEQRIMSGAAGLEHVLWQSLVLGGRITSDQFNGRTSYQGRKLAGHDRLRLVLEDARIPLDIDGTLLPVIAEHVAQAPRSQNRVPDGADMVTWTRNRLVHPEGTQERVYRLNGLVAEVWLLTRHYLTLLILNSLDYQGAYRDLRRRHGWASETEKVPWANLTTST